MNPADWERLFTDVNLIGLGGEPGGDWGVIRDAALAVRDGKIAWLGKRSELPDGFRGETVGCDGYWMSPGLVDCHTHLVYGGSRIREFEQRLNGASYAGIAAAGGGILSTVGATRAASADELYDSAAKRLWSLIEDGVTTVEIKSGYGLDSETEIKMMHVARRLGRDLPVSIFTTFLGAHSLPEEFKTDRRGYIALLCNELIPTLARDGLADAVDCYCEEIAFTPSEAATIFEAAQASGLRVKLHADQLSDSGGAALAARFGALSADHLEHASEAGIAAMAKAGTVAVLLPGAFYSLRETRLPPIGSMRAQGVAMALATDCNPGTSPVLSLRLMINMGCTLFGLTPLEAVRAVTVNAARALGLCDRGMLGPGLRADLALWNISEPAELAYAIGGNLCVTSFCAGQSVKEK